MFASFFGMLIFSLPNENSEVLYSLDIILVTKLTYRVLVRPSMHVPR